MGEWEAQSEVIGKNQLEYPSLVEGGAGENESGVLGSGACPASRPVIFWTKSPSKAKTPPGSPDIQLLQLRRGKERMQIHQAAASSLVLHCFTLQPRSRRWKRLWRPNSQRISAAFGGSETPAPLHTGALKKSENKRLKEVSGCKTQTRDHEYAKSSC